MKSKFIIFVVIAVIFVIGLGIFTNKAQGPGKYDDFAKALKTQGAEFYGAFWCPHCQAEKALFGTSKQYLPYIECSNPDQSATKICVDKKIESYPTWFFKDGIKLISKDAPTVCKVNPDPTTIPGEPAACTPQATSRYYKTWIFPNYKFTVKSPTDPTMKDDIWQFPKEAETTGEVPLEFLAQQIGYTLPQ